MCTIFCNKDAKNWNVGCCCHPCSNEHSIVKPRDKSWTNNAGQIPIQCIILNDLHNNNNQIIVSNAENARLGLVYLSVTVWLQQKPLFYKFCFICNLYIIENTQLLSKNIFFKYLFVEFLSFLSTRRVPNPPYRQVRVLYFFRLYIIFCEHSMTPRYTKPSKW